jgi:hypothetical protein
VISIEGVNLNVDDCHGRPPVCSAIVRYRDWIAQSDGHDEKRDAPVAVNATWYEYGLIMHQRGRWCMNTWRGFPARFVRII